MEHITLINIGDNPVEGVACAEKIVLAPWRPRAFPAAQARVFHHHALGASLPVVIYDPKQHAEEVIKRMADEAHLEDDLRLGLLKGDPNAIKLLDMVRSRFGGMRPPMQRTIQMAPHEQLRRWLEDLGLPVTKGPGGPPYSRPEMMELLSVAFGHQSVGGAKEEPEPAESEAAPEAPKGAKAAEPGPGKAKG